MPSKNTVVLAIIVILFAVTGFYSFLDVEKQASSTVLTGINNGNNISGTSPASSDGSGSESHNALQNGLQAYYRFDNPQVSHGSSLEFDGADDYVGLGKPAELTFENTHFTVSAWVKASSDGSRYGRIIGGDSGGGTSSIHGYRLFEDGDEEEWRFSIGNTTNYADASFSANYGNETWAHLTGVYNGTHAVLYINGEERVATHAGPVTPDWSNVSRIDIGRRGTETANYFGGLIDDVRIFNRSLSPTEAENLYDERSVSKEALILHQTFDEGSGNCDLTGGSACLEDKSGEGNDGTPQNFDDNNRNTGSGWVDETPLNTPVLQDSGAQSSARVYGRYNGIFSGDPERVDSSIGPALELDGDDGVVVEDESELRNPGDISLSIWFWHNDSYDPSTDRWTLMNKNLDGAWRWETYEDGLYFWFTYEGDTDYSSYHARNLGYGSETEQWHHAVVTRDVSENEIKHYYDGELVQTRTMEDRQIAVTNSDIGIGAASDGDRPLNGKIANPRIYDRPITESEVESLYSKEKARKGLQAEWRFEEGRGERAYDTSGLNHDGILGTESVRGDSRVVSRAPVGLNDNSLSIWADTDLKDKVTSQGRLFATFCPEDTEDNHATFSIASTEDGNRIDIGKLSDGGDVTDEWSNVADKGDLWRFRCDDYGSDEAFVIESLYPVSVDYESMLDSRTSDDDWTSRAGEDLWFSMPNDNNELTVTAYRDGTEVRMTNYSDGNTYSFSLDEGEYWRCTDCTDEPAAHHIETNDGHPVTILYGKFDDNSGSTIFAPTRTEYRVSKHYAEQPQAYYVVADQDDTDVEVVDLEDNCDNRTETLGRGEVLSGSCADSALNLRANSSRPVSMTLTEQKNEYGNCMFSSSSNSWGIGSEYAITACNEEGNGIDIISLAENNSVRIRGDFSYSNILGKYENEADIATLSQGESIFVEADHPVVVSGNSDRNYEAAMTVIPLPEKNMVGASDSGIGLSKDRIFGYGSGSLVSADRPERPDWNHYLLSQGSGLDLYFNGETIYSAGISSEPSLGPVEIGGINGELDDARVYNRSVSGNEARRMAFLRN